MAEGEEPDESQKTEEPTPKRLEEARKKGQVPMSREINNWLMLLVGTLIIATLSPIVFTEIRETMKQYVEFSYAMPTTPSGIGSIFRDILWDVLRILMLPVLALVFIAIAGPLAQIGPLFTTETIKPDIGKISPLKGFKRLFSLRSLIEFVKGLFKIAIIAVVAFILVRPFYNNVEHFVGLPVPYVLDELHMLFIRLMTGILVVLVVIAVLDLVYQRYEHHKKMKMTRQEIKDEFKSSEGDPEVKARLRRLRAERARGRMMQNVPQADVVITNPTHFSIALKYDPETMDAPVCIAKGIDEIALRIREVAQDHDIILYENKPLARILYDTVDIDEIIPTEHYKAVAEIISYVFRLKGKI